MFFGVIFNRNEKCENLRLSCNGVGSGGACGLIFIIFFFFWSVPFLFIGKFIVVITSGREVKAGTPFRSGSAWVRYPPTPTHKTCLLSAVGDLK